MKTYLFQLKKRLTALSKLQIRRVQRLMVTTTMTPDEAWNVPIILNNRNRYTYLKGLIEWLSAAGYKNIFILDNDSDYPDLLEYYKQTPAKVIYLKKNMGYMALWNTRFFQTIKRGYYVYSDSDLIPGGACPNNLVYRLYQVLSKHAIEKCGPALKIDDLPDVYERKKEVLEFEAKHWEKLVEKNVYDAPIDTTFALYKPFAYGNAEETKAYRVGGEFSFIHLPWYEDSKNMSNENTYYKENASSSSYWYTKK